MKALCHIPTEQYGFVEVEIEVANEHAALDAYESLQEYAKSGDGLSQDEWNETLDNYRRDKGMQEGRMSRLSARQSWLIHELDKSNNRLAYKASRENSKQK